jgi:thiosulfate/3-mercaptopyruvate sulfurtransferase
VTVGKDAPGISTDHWIVRVKSDGHESGCDNRQHQNKLPDSGRARAACEIFGRCELKLHIAELFIVGAVLGCAPIMTAAGCGGHGTRESMLVNTAWLAEHLHDANVVILAVGKKDEYASGHISGSGYLDSAELRKSTPPAINDALTLELPSAEQARDVLAKAGVRDGSRIVLYSTADNATMTARIYLTLDAMGLGAATSILDGGLAAWRREGHPVTQDMPAVTPGKLQLCPQNDVVASLDYVRSQVRKPNTAIVDARLPEYYSGEKIPPQRRAGHIPGAINIPFASLLDESGRMLPPETLQQKFEAAGAHHGEQVITYCHIGQQASLAYFVARYLGYDSRMFDGSWQEWSAHTELPAETSAGAATR